MMKVKKWFIKDKNWLYFIAFILPVLAAGLGFFWCLNYDFSGDLSPVYGDFQAQYTALFTYLQDVIAGENSIVYTFTKGLGGNMASTVAYYLMSPLNILISLVDAIHVPYMLLFMVLIKMGLAGLFMYIFLSYTFKKKDWQFLIFSTCYALSSFVINYYYCVMWLDAVYMAPLVFLGIKRLVEGKSSIMYIISLALTIISNYYTGYMVCIFSCIYFIYEIIMNNKYKDKKEFFSLIIKFILSSLLSGMMTMFILVPMFLDLSTTSRNVGVANFASARNLFDYHEVIYRSLIGSYSSSDVMNYGAISIYCGIIILPLLYFYFVNKNISKKEKLFSLGMILLFFASYSIKYINYIWHGFSFPNGLNYRFTFVFIFYFMLMACKSMMKIKSIKKINYYIYLLCFLTIMNILVIFTEHRSDIVNIYISTGCLIFYLIILYNLHSIKIDKKSKKDLSIILVLLVTSELFFNTYISLRGNYGTTVKEYHEYVEIYSQVIEKYKNNSNEFYRMGQDGNFTLNPGLMLNYNGMTTFLSTHNKLSMTFLDNNGYAANQLSVIHNTKDHIIMDSILGLKYYLTRDDCGLYEEIDTFKISGFSGLMYGSSYIDSKVCENKNALSLGFIIDNNWGNYGNDLKNISYLDISSTILNSMVGESNEYYTKYEAEAISNDEYNVKLDDSDIFYITFLYVQKPDSLEIYVNDELVKNVVMNPDGIYSIKNNYKNETVNIKIVPEYDDNYSVIDLGLIQFFKEDYDKISSSLQQLKKHELKIETFTNTYIKGKVEATTDKNILFTSIPYDTGWNVYVDGIKVEPKILYDTFIGVELNEGTHTVEFKYSVHGVKTGCTISGISLVSTIIYLWFERKKRKESQIMLEK